MKLFILFSICSMWQKKLDAPWTHSFILDTQPKPLPQPSCIYFVEPRGSVVGWYMFNTSSVVCAFFHSVRIPTKPYFKPPTGCHSMWSWEKIHRTLSWDQMVSTPLRWWVLTNGMREGTGHIAGKELCACGCFHSNSLALSQLGGLLRKMIKMQDGRRTNSPVPSVFRNICPGLYPSEQWTTTTSKHWDLRTVKAISLS